MFKLVDGMLINELKQGVLDLRGIFPNGELKGISEQAFSNIRINKLIIPASVEFIGNAAFSNCKIQEVEFEDNSQLKEIDDYAFFGNKINYLNLPKGLQRLGEESFSDNEKLVEIIIPPSVKEIDDNCFCDTNCYFHIVVEENSVADNVLAKTYNHSALVLSEENFNNYKPRSYNPHEY